jgi:hypothetical protein
MKRLGLIAALTVALTLVGVGVAAGGAWFHDGYVHGNNSPYAGDLFVATVGTTDTSIILAEEWPYSEARVDGFSGFVGSSGVSWLIDTYSAKAEARVSLVPFGKFDGTTRHFVGKTLKTEARWSRDFGNPPNDDPPPCEGWQDPQYEGEECTGSPILVPTGQSQAIKLTKVADGVVFDLMAVGTPQRVAWTTAGAEVAFLVLDRNGNGLIDDGRELFGDATLPGVANGFAALRQTPGHDGDGAITAADPLYHQLQLWTDRNHNGVSEADELRPVSEVFEAIGLGYTYGPRRDGFGNQFRYQGWARRLSTRPPHVPRPGDQEVVTREIKIYDVFLAIAR